MLRVPSGANTQIFGAQQQDLDVGSPAVTTLLGFLIAWPWKCRRRQSDGSVASPVYRAGMRLFDKVGKLSADQNDGKNASSRLCQPEKRR